VNAGLGASIGGSNGINAGGGAAIGGSNGVGAGVGVRIGGSSGGGALPGNPGGVAPGGSRPVAGSPPTGGINPGSRPGTIDRATTNRLTAELNRMSETERQQLRRSCATVLASPASHEADMAALCNLMSRMSSR
jgi:hypothetical protein